MNRTQVMQLLKTLDFDKKDYWVLAGGAMVLYGLRAETGDLDLGCTTALADALEAKGYAPVLMKDGTRKIQYSEEIEIFENWLYDRVETLEDFPVISLSGLLTMKQGLGREKDQRDVRLIQAHMRRNAAEGNVKHDT